MDSAHHLPALVDFSDDADHAHVHPNIMNLIKCIEVFTLVHVTANGWSINSMWERTPQIHIAHCTVSFFFFNRTSGALSSTFLSGANELAQAGRKQESDPKWAWQRVHPQSWRTCIYIYIHYVSLCHTNVLSFMSLIDSTYTIIHHLNGYIFAPSPHYDLRFGPASAARPRHWFLSLRLVANQGRPDATPLSCGHMYTLPSRPCRRLWQMSGFTGKMMAKEMIIMLWLVWLSWIKHEIQIETSCGNIWKPETEK